MVYGYPIAIKPFYMKKDPKDPKIARNVDDVLAPEGYGKSSAAVSAKKTSAFSKRRSAPRDSLRRPIPGTSISAATAPSPRGLRPRNRARGRVDLRISARARNRSVPRLPEQTRP